MKIIGASREQIEEALARTNEHMHGNIRFKDIRQEKTRRDGREVFRLTLTVHDTKEIGSRRAPETWARIPAACWHAYGLFMDSLPAGTEIRSTNATMHAGDKWQDYNIGSQARPCMASRACNCMDWNTSGVLPFPVNV